MLQKHGHMPNLSSHINKTAETAGYTRLSTIHKSTVNTILDEADIKPHKITYYCENRDPDFDAKMHNVLACIQTA